MADSGNEALDAIARRQNLAIDSTVAWFQRELRGIVSQAQVEVLEKITRRLTVRDGVIEASTANQRRLRRLDTMVVDAMNGAGYRELLDELSGSFGGQLRFFEEALEVLGQKPVAWNAEDSSRMRAQGESTVDALEGIVRNAAELAKRRALLQIGGLSVGVLAETLQRETGATIGQATAIADTAQSTFYRTIADTGFQRIEQRQKKPLRYRYYGPDDRLNRPFCAKVLAAQEPKSDDDEGRSWTRAEIQAMDNGQLPNPFITGGGYRCRHQWMVVAEKTDAETKAAAARAADPENVVRVGRVDRAVAKAFAPRNPEATIVLTQERLDHFAEKPGREDLFGPRQVVQAVLDPELVYRSKADPMVGEFYRQLDEERLLKVVVKFAARKGAKKHSILTAIPVSARKYRRPPRRDLVWQRPEAE